MKLMPKKNHEFARIMNCEIMKCEDPLYLKKIVSPLYRAKLMKLFTVHTCTILYYILFFRCHGHSLQTFYSWHCLCVVYWDWFKLTLTLVKAVTEASLVIWMWMIPISREWWILAMQFQVQSRFSKKATKF